MQLESNQKQPESNQLVEGDDLERLEPIALTGQWAVWFPFIYLTEWASAANASLYRAAQFPLGILVDRCKLHL